MADYSESIRAQYGRDGLVESILAAYAAAGKDVDNLTVEDTESFDQFHIRGHLATSEMIELAELRADMHLLDIGCGVGGPCRTLAHRIGCTVVGLDLVEEYCRAARVLTDRLGLSERVSFQQGDVAAMPFEDASFDVVWSQHMTMNISDKGALFAEIRRVIRPGGKAAMYEICAGETAPVIFPVPWADDDSVNFLATPDELRESYQAHGFGEIAWRDVTAPSLDWFREMLQALAKRSADAPPLLGLNLLMGESTRNKIANILTNLEENRIRVIQTILRPGGA